MKTAVYFPPILLLSNLSKRGKVKTDKFSEIFWSGISLKAAQSTMRGKCLNLYSMEWLKYRLLFRFITARFCPRMEIKVQARKNSKPSVICLNIFRIWSSHGSVFSLIRTEYRNLQIKSPYSVQIRENTYQKNSAIGYFSCYFGYWAWRGVLKRNNTLCFSLSSGSKLVLGFQNSHIRSLIKFYHVFSC